MAAVVACDIHPLNNLRVLQVLRREHGDDEGAVARWTARWIGDGFAALEALAQRHGDRFAFGDTLTRAGCRPSCPDTASPTRCSLGRNGGNRMIRAACGVAHRSRDRSSIMSRIRVASASTANGLVIIAMPGSRKPFATAAFSA